MEIQVFLSHLRDGHLVAQTEGKGKAARQVLVATEPIEGVVARQDSEVGASTPDDVFAMAAAIAEGAVSTEFTLAEGTKWLPRPGGNAIVESTSRNGKPGSWLFLVPADDPEDEAF
jgi:hypothetical protein